MSEGIGTHLISDITNTNELGVIKVGSNLAITSNMDNSQTVQIQDLYLQFAGQLGNIIVGQTSSLFSDVDALPLSVNLAGPNGQIYANHALMAYGKLFMLSEQTALRVNVGYGAAANECHGDACYYRRKRFFQGAGLHSEGRTWATMRWDTFSLLDFFAASMSKTTPLLIIKMSLATDFTSAACCFPVAFATG